MNFGVNLGKKIIGYGERMAVSELEKMYGKQIGITAPNGNRTFQKVVDGRKITDRDIVEVSHTRMATNFRKTTVDPEKDVVTTRVFDIKPEGGKYKYAVTSTNIDRSGNVTQETRYVKVKGKESPLDK